MQLEEGVLALLHLNIFEDRRVVRAWTTFDWDAMDRLHERGLISDPRSNARSVILIEEGQRVAEEAFWRLLTSRR